MRGKAILSVLPTTLLSEAKKEKLGRVYFEQIKAIAQSVAKTGGYWYNVSYEDATSLKIEPEDNRAAEEMVQDVARRAGLEII